MKPQFLASAGLAATLFVLPVRAADQAPGSGQVVPPAPAPSGGSHVSATDTEILRRYDKNGDGKLDAAERETMERTLRARLEKSPRMLQRFDTDGDGKLSDAEWAAVREKTIARFEKEAAK